MRIFQIAAAVLTITASLAHAGLVEVTSSTYFRESANPATEFLEVTLENAGEIRVSNVNLQDDAIEPTAATEVVLNGSPLMQPFTLPTGGSTVFPLAAGTHTLEVTLAGKPGGGIRVAFYEDKPGSPNHGKGWELLDDGTVLHRKTGLIWHRNLASPGLGLEDYLAGQEITADGYSCGRGGCISDYIAKLNGGEYGDDPIDGNAGYTDWRSPSSSELLAVLDFRSNPPLPDAEGNIGEPRLYLYGGTFGVFGGMLPGQPLIFCWNPDEYGGLFDAVVERCPQYQEVYNFITNDVNYGYARYPSEFGRVNISFYGDYQLVNGRVTGSVWPVRSGQPE